MSVTPIKCPNCGANFTQASTDPTLKCPYCSTLVTNPIAQIQRASTSVTRWSVGARVFAYCDDDAYYYPATITAINGETISIRYDDGDETEDTTNDSLEELMLEVGNWVEYWEEDDEGYYEVEVLSVTGDTLKVQDEAGEQFDVTMAEVRYGYGAWSESGRVFAYYAGDGYYYAATVIAIDDEGKVISIRYDSGEEEDTDNSNLEDLALAAGDWVECWDDDEADYYEVEVVRLSDDTQQVQVKYDSEQWWEALENIRVSFEEE